MRFGRAIVAVGVGSMALAVLTGCPHYEADTLPAPMAELLPSQAAPSDVPLILPQPAGAAEPSPYLAQPQVTDGQPITDEQVDAARLNPRGGPIPGGGAATVAPLIDREAAALRGRSQPAVVAAPSRNPTDAGTVARRIQTGDVTAPVADPTGQIVGRVAPPGPDAVAPAAPQPQRQTPPSQGEFQVIGPGTVTTPGGTPPPAQ